MLDVLELMRVRHFGLVDDRLDIFIKLLHDVFVLQLGDVHVFALHVCVEERALLRRVTVFKALVPP